MMTYRRHVLGAVAVVVMLIQGSAARAQVQQPKSDREYFDAPRETIIQSLKLSPPRLTEPLERTIHEEMKSLAALTGLSDAVWIVRGGGAHSHPDVGVIVDLDQIAAIKRSMPNDEFLPVLRWIIAHEQAHQVQFRQYSASIANADPSDREVYEAQADILAGKYLIETLANTTEQDRRGVTNTLKAAFTLGVERYALADHPSKEARLTAARLGMAAGMMVKMVQLGGPAPMESAATLARTLDYHGGEDVLPWSLRTARRIVNYRRPAIVDLVLVDERAERTSEPGRSVTSFWFTYDNRGARDLFVDEEVQCVTATLADPDDVFGWQKWSVINRTFFISPRKPVTISGAVACPSEGDTVTRVVAAPHPTGLIRVEYADEDRVAASTSADGVSMLASTGARFSYEFVLKRLAAAAVTGWLPVRAGPGRKVNDFVAYPADVSLPDAVETMVWIPERPGIGGGYARSVLCRTRSRADGTKCFSDGVSNTRQALGTFGDWKETRARNDTGEELEFSQGTVSILIRRAQLDDRQVVTLTVSAK